jgi:hypothetical protein
MFNNLFTLVGPGFTAAALLAAILTVGILLVASIGVSGRPRLAR